MSSYPVRSSIVTEADSPITVEMGASTSQRWSEISIRIFDDNNDPVTNATGTISAQVIKSGSDKPQDFKDPIDLSVGPWNWIPELSTVKKFIFTVSGLNAGYSVQFTVNNWSS